MLYADHQYELILLYVLGFVCVWGLYFAMQRCDGGCPSNPVRPQFDDLTTPCWWGLACIWPVVLVLLAALLALSAVAYAIDRAAAGCRWGFRRCLGGWFGRLKAVLVKERSMQRLGHLSPQRLYVK